MLWNAGVISTCASQQFRFKIEITFRLTIAEPGTIATKFTSCEECELRMSPALLNIWSCAADEFDPETRINSSLFTPSSSTNSTMASRLLGRLSDDSPERNRNSARAGGQVGVRFSFTPSAMSLRKTAASSLLADIFMFLLRFSATHTHTKKKESGHPWAHRLPARSHPTMKDAQSTVMPVQSTLASCHCLSLFA